METTSANSITKAGYVSILTSDKFEIIDHAYNATGPYRDAMILSPFPLEDSQIFLERREISPYPNFTKPIVDAMVRPVFAKGVEIETNDPMLDVFLENCDNSGTYLVDELFWATTETRMKSSVFVCMDNFRPCEIPATTAEAIANRAIPYIYIKPAESVCEEHCQIDRFGNVIVYTFYNGKITVDKNEFPKMLTFTANETTEWYMDGKNNKQIVSESTHNLGTVPVVRQMDNKCKSNCVRPEPKIYDIVKMNTCAFNQYSEIRNLERTQGFCILTVATDNPENISVGAAGLLTVPTSTPWAPTYVSPNSSVNNQLLTGFNTTVDAIYKLAEQNGVIGVKSAKSGVALAYEFQGHNSMLQETAHIVESMADSIIYLFGLFTNSNPEYSIKVPKKFDPTDTQERLILIGEILDKAQSSALKALAEKELARMLYPEIDSDSMAEIESMIDSEMTDALNVNADDGADETV